ncbi:MAG: class I SAM-dependent methyltransferase family protein [Candidatus Thorarchaeota archaeon]
MQYRDFLRKETCNTIPDYISLPRGYYLVGYVALLTLSSGALKYKKEIGKATLDYNDKIKSVALKIGPTRDLTRKPHYELVAGNRDTLTTHIENGVVFRIDPLKFTFSRGNRHERINIPTIVQHNEFVVDMFACVGQFALHIARNTDARVTAIEINPEAFELLQENIRLNRVENRVDALLGDCREIHPIGAADRVIMGYLHDSIEYLPAGLETLKPIGGWIHLHSGIPKHRIGYYCNTIDTIAREAGFSANIETREIKHYSPGIVHYVFDIFLAPY